MEGKNEEALRSLPLVAGFEAETIDFMVDRMQEVTVPIGGHIVKQGDFAYRFFVILEGSATVSRGGCRVAELKADDVFGEMALIDDVRRRSPTMLRPWCWRASFISCCCGRSFGS
jgi:CRP-like cAMP-binding protein